MNIQKYIECSLNTTVLPSYECQRVYHNGGDYKLEVIFFLHWRCLWPFNSATNVSFCWREWLHKTSDSVSCGVLSGHYTSLWTSPSTEMCLLIGFPRGRGFGQWGTLFSVKGCPNLKNETNVYSSKVAVRGRIRTLDLWIINQAPCWIGYAGGDWMT